jgi:hypothetical protein
MRDLSKDKENVLQELRTLLNRYGYDGVSQRVFQRLDSIFLGYALRYTDDDHSYGIELVELMDILRKPGNIDVMAPTSRITICSNRLKSALLNHLEYLYIWFVQNDEGIDIEPNDALEMLRRATKADDRYYKLKLPARRLGFQLSYVYSELKSYGVFGEKLTRKDLCFLYDYLTILGQVEEYAMYEFSGDAIKDKADTIRDWIRAYKRMDH